MNLGAYLREARERRGLTIQDIARTTKISSRFLEAIEQNDMSKLPGGIFSRSFVRMYAKEVDLDPEEVVNLLLQQFSDEGVNMGSPQAVARERAEESRRARERRQLGVRSVLFAVLVVLAVGGVTFWTLQGRDDLAVSRSEAPASEPVSSAPLLDRVPAEAAAPPAAVDAVPALAPRPEPRTLRIEVQPTGRCWVRLTVDGQVQLERLMLPGERETREATRAILVEVGDAGSFAFSINDRPGRPLGRSGQVVRAAIDFENLSSFLAQ